MSFQTRAKQAPGPNLTLALLMTAALVTTFVLGWLAWRLLLAAWGVLDQQQGFHRMAEVCMLVFSSSDPADRLLAYAFVAVLIVIIGLGLWTLVSHLRRTNDALRDLHQGSHEIEPGLARAIAEAGLNGKVVLIESAQPFAFCYGTLRSQICISTGLVSLIGSGRELEALLLHEGYHLRHRDPLKMAVAGALVQAYFFLPVAKDLYNHYLAVRELAADEAASAAQGTHRPLATALYRLAMAHPAQTKPSLVAHALDPSQKSVLNARFEAILGNATSYPLRIAKVRLLISVVVVVSSALLLAFSYTAHNGLVLLTIEHWLQGYC